MSGPLLELASGFSGDAMQDVIIGGAIVSAVGAALINGTKARFPAHISSPVCNVLLLES